MWDPSGVQVLQAAAKSSKPTSRWPNEIGPDVHGKAAPLAGKVQEIALAKLAKLTPRKRESPAQSEPGVPDITFCSFQFIQ